MSRRQWRKERCCTQVKSDKLHMKFVILHMKSGWVCVALCSVRLLRISVIKCFPVFLLLVSQQRQPQQVYTILIVHDAVNRATRSVRFLNAPAYICVFFFSKNKIIALHPIIKYMRSTFSCWGFCDDDANHSYSRLYSIFTQLIKITWMKSTQFIYYYNADMQKLFISCCKNKSNDKCSNRHNYETVSRAHQISSSQPTGFYGQRHGSLSVEQSYAFVAGFFKRSPQEPNQLGELEEHLNIYMLRLLIKKKECVFCVLFWTRKKHIFSKNVVAFLLQEY